MDLLSIFLILTTRISYKPRLATTTDADSDSSQKQESLSYWKYDVLQVLPCYEAITVQVVETRNPDHPVQEAASLQYRESRHKILQNCFSCQVRALGGLGVLENSLTVNVTLPESVASIKEKM